MDVEKGIPLGILQGAEYEELTAQIQPGDRLLLYTDGIIEAFNEQKVVYGVDRLKKAFQKNTDDSPDQTLDIIMQDLEEFVQRPLDVEPLEDDVTLVSIDFSEEHFTITSTVTSSSPNESTEKHLQ